MLIKTLFHIFLACLYISAASAQERLTQMVRTDWVEDDKAVALELVIYKPTGAGPFPTLVFNHGSVDNGNNPQEVTFTASYPALAKYFTDKGWMVVAPQRRGRGKSGGKYAEGWDAELGRYTCDANTATVSIEHAMQDLDVVMKHLQTLADVDQHRLLIGGHSKGGILAMTYAARQPKRFAGVVNYVGGWVGERCETASEVNVSLFTQAAAFKGATLWLYGQRDPYYSIEHSKKNFAAFQAAGGQGVFHVFSLGFLRNDHQIVRQPEVWQDTMSGYLSMLKQ